MAVWPAAMYHYVSTADAIIPEFKYLLKFFEKTLAFFSHLCYNTYI